MKEPKNLEALVISHLMDSYGLLEVGGVNDLQDASSGGRLVQLWASVVDRQGQILAKLAIKSATRVELMFLMEGLVNRAPAFLDAHLLEKKKMTVDLFLHGMAQTMAAQRQAIKRVVAEQMREPTTLEEILRGPPIPENPKETERNVLMSALADAVTAHSEVLIGIAAEIDALTQASQGTDG